MLLELLHNKTSQAIQDYSKYTAFDPEEPATYKFRGDCYRMLEQYAEAIQDYDAAIERDPEYALAHYNRGLTYEKLGQNEQAANDYNVYLKLRGTEDENADKIRQQIRELGYTSEF
jgi:tetratricopeptide (TPR) repeat protein